MSLQLKSWGSSRIERHLPSILGGALYLAALFSLLLLASQSTNGALNRLIRFTVFGFGFLGLPVSSSFFNIALVSLLAALLVRRKWLAWMIVLVYQAAIMLANIVVMFDERSIHWLDIGSVLANLVIIVALIWGRKAFPGTIDRRALWAGLGVFALGFGIVFVLGLLAGHWFNPATSVWQQAWWVLYRLFGVEFFLLWEDLPSTEPGLLGLLISLGGAIVLVLSTIFFSRVTKVFRSSFVDDLQVRTLVARFPNDSLGYYATRAHRLVVFSPNRQAAVSFGLSTGAAIAGADPIGDPKYWHEAIREWLKLCFRNGWAPGVLSVSERGARAYRRAGFKIRSMGDEAIIHTADFSVSSLQSKSLSQSVRRVRRHGVRIVARRLEQIPADELGELKSAANKYRQGPERGFTMSLDRILEAEDPRTMVVTARDDHMLHAVLTFVPWGRHGLSLNLMRRHPNCVNGVIEAMVVHLIESAKDMAISDISLNFAMFRSAFVAGKAVNATVFHRLLLSLMRFGSRFWQLESLYESNARYSPEWFPRYLGILHTSQSFSVLAACARLEGFLPSFSYRSYGSRQWRADAAHLKILIQADNSAVDTSLGGHFSEQELVRREKAAELTHRGRDPYPAGAGLPADMTKVLELSRQCLPGAEYSLQMSCYGRLRSIRDMGGVVFVDLYQGSQKIQLILEKNRLDKADFSDFSLLDLGDLVQVSGFPARSHSGEPSLQVQTWQLLAKSLRPWPRVGEALDAKTKTRDRTLDLAHSSSALELIRMRSVAISRLREILWQAGYLEVETPILQPVRGGANARPFVTHMRAYATNVYLRIAPELYLKRLAVAGMTAIFELGRSFRNEGADNTHNPEFTSLEVYRAGADYSEMRRLTQTLIQAAALALFGAEVCLRPRKPDSDDEVFMVIEGVEMSAVDISGDWPVVSVLDAVSTACGTKVNSDTPVSELLKICREHQIEVPSVAEPGELITALYDDLVEAKTVMPTFYTDFPLGTSPLTRRSRTNPDLAERWDLVAFGMELGTAYTELTDPRDQRERFVQQSLAAAAGDPEAMSVDNDFLAALDLGMAPMGGLGLGVDRLLMLLTGTNIRQTLAFPFVRPQDR